MSLSTWSGKRREQKEVEAARKKTEAEEKERDTFIRVAVVPPLVNRALASAEKDAGESFTRADAAAILKMFTDFARGPTSAVLHFISSGRHQLLAAFLYHLLQMCSTVSSVHSEIVKALAAEGITCTEDVLNSAVDFVLGCALNTVDRILRQYSATFGQSLTRITGLVGELDSEEYGPVTKFALGQLRATKKNGSGAT